AASAWAQVWLWAGAVWCVFGAVGGEGDPELCDSGCGCFGEERPHAGGFAGVVGEGAGDDGVGAGAASVAAGVDRCAGAALRLLPERHDDPGRRSAVDDEESDRGSDPDGDERASVPVWDLSADPDGDQAGRRRDGEGWCVEMTGFMHERELSRKSFLKGGGAMVVGFSLAGAGLGARVAKGAGEDPFASNGPDDQIAVDSWLISHGANTP